MTLIETIESNRTLIVDYQSKINELLCELDVETESIFEYIDCVKKMYYYKGYMDSLIAINPKLCIIQMQNEIAEREDKKDAS